MKHYYRTFTTKQTAHKVGYPDYLVNFKPPVHGETEDALELIKSGRYDLHHEELLLNKLGSLIGINNLRVNQIVTKQLGLIPQLKLRNKGAGKFSA